VTDTCIVTWQNVVELQGYAPCTSPLFLLSVCVCLRVLRWMAFYWAVV